MWFWVYIHNRNCLFQMNLFLMFISIFRLDSTRHHPDQKCIRMVKINKQNQFSQRVFGDENHDFNLIQWMPMNKYQKLEWFWFRILSSLIIIHNLMQWAMQWQTSLWWVIWLKSLKFHNAVIKNQLKFKFVFCLPTGNLYELKSDAKCWIRLCDERIFIHQNWRIISNRL